MRRRFHFLHGRRRHSHHLLLFMPFASPSPPSPPLCVQTFLQQDEEKNPTLAWFFSSRNYFAIHPSSQTDAMHFLGGAFLRVKYMGLVSRVLGWLMTAHFPPTTSSSSSSSPSVWRRRADPFLFWRREREKENLLILSPLFHSARRRPRRIFVKEDKNGHFSSLSLSLSLISPRPRQAGMPRVCGCENPLRLTSGAGFTNFFFIGHADRRIRSPPLPRHFCISGIPSSSHICSAKERRKSGFRKW